MNKRWSDPHRKPKIAINESLTRVFASLLEDAKPMHLEKLISTLPEPDRQSLIRAAHLLRDRRKSRLRPYLFVEQQVLEIAASYLRQSAQDAQRLDAKTRSKLLRDLVSATRRVLKLLPRADSDPETSWRLMYNARSLSLDTPLSQVAFPIKQLQERAERALKPCSKRGRAANRSLHIFVQRLCELYEHVTGKPTTHNTHERGVATSVPRSRAGRFIIDVAKIDPRITPQQVSSILKELVAHRRRQMVTRENSPPRDPN